MDDLSLREEEEEEDEELVLVFKARRHLENLFRESVWYTLIVESSPLDVRLSSSRKRQFCGV